jgi:glycerophosphoryl diester phosphodiesterase
VPENTLRGFKRALERGADGVELDVQRSADGVPVVIHDATLERTTRGRGRVDAFSAAELGRADVGGEGVPTLAAAARWAAEHRAWLNVEIKARGVETATLAVLEAAGVLDRTVISSFDPETVREVGRLDGEIRRFLLTEECSPDLIRMVREIGAGGVCLGGEGASDAALAGLAAAALPVIVWTVDEPQRMRSLIAAGVAGIITNVPEHGAAARGGSD